MYIKSLVLVAVLAAGLVGCVEGTENKPQVEPECQGTQCEPDPRVDPVIDGVFVSAHLGNYASCPEDGYTADGSDALVSVDSDGAFAPCQEGEICDYEMNCEDGQFTLQLTNSGSATATGISIEKIELFNSLGESVATLPTIAFIDTATDESFDGSLDSGEVVTLRVDFQGPNNPYSLLTVEDGDADQGLRSTNESGSLEVTVGADNHRDLIVAGKGVYSVPSVDT